MKLRVCVHYPEQSLLSRETVQNAFFSELCPFYDLAFLSIKHSTVEHWHLPAVLLNCDILLNLTLVWQTHKNQGLFGKGLTDQNMKSKFC